MTERRLLGYWRDVEHPEYPDPAAFVDDSWDEQEQHELWAYLSSGVMAVAFAGLSTCRICGESNGSLEFTDGAYQWPEGLAHYVTEHNVRLPEEFITHIRRRIAELEDATATLDWWLAIAPPLRE